MKRWPRLIGTLFLLLAARAGAAPLDLSALAPTECQDADLYSEYEAHCGYLTTSEGEGGRQIKLAVAVLTPLDADAASRPPTVFIHGGPGIGIVKSWWSFAGTPLAEHAPLILFDQRGVGLSSPRLCADLDQDRPWLDTAAVEEQARIALAQTKTCLTALRKDGADLAVYGTGATVRDMETLRTALKIDRWNIYGVSYGTTVGLAYIAEHPDHIRAAILDSVYPPEMQGFTTVVPDFANALTALNKLCEAQARCRVKFGDLPSALSATMTALDKSPLPINPIRNSKPGDRRSISGSTLFTIVNSAILFSSDWQYAPTLIGDARARRPSPLLARAVGRILDDIDDQRTAVYLATECAERAALEDRAALKRTAAQWPEFARAAQIESQLDICDLWPVRRERWNTPRNTPVKTLVVAGEWDPVTPSEQARRTAQILGSNAKFLLVPKAAHSPSLLAPCAEAMTVRFLANPNQAPGVACALAEAPALATRVIDVDANAAYDLDALPATSFIFIFSLVSAFGWPTHWLARKAAGAPRSTTPVAARSTTWLTLATLSLVACGYPLSAMVRADNADARTWLAEGVPAEAWPTFPLLALALIASAAAALALLREVTGGTKSAAQLFHRGIVLASLLAGAISFAKLGVIDQLPAHIVDELAEQVALLQR